MRLLRGLALGLVLASLSVPFILNSCDYFGPSSQEVDDAVTKLVKNREARLLSITRLVDVDLTSRHKVDNDYWVWVKCEEVYLFDDPLRDIYSRGDKRVREQEYVIYRHNDRWIAREPTGFDRLVKSHRQGRG